MSLFCLLWMPLFYLFWRTVTGNNTAAGGIWAILAGSVVALIQFFLGALVQPGGFGFSRWWSGFIDIVVVPALLPLVVYLFLIGFKVLSGNVDFANFALLWLIPAGAIRAVSWSSDNNPILLLLVPVLWTAISVGIPFFINIIQNSRIYFIVPAALGILIIPFASASSYWAFFSQKTSFGFLFLLAAAAPMLVSMTLSYFQTGEGV